MLVYKQKGNVSSWNVVVAVVQRVVKHMEYLSFKKFQVNGVRIARSGTDAGFTLDALNHVRYSGVCG